MAIPAQAMANTILKMSFKEEIDVTPMKLQKLLYFIYRDYLKKTNVRLFSERFECWRYGPVLSSIYSEFKSFGSKPITKFARNADGGGDFIELKTVPILRSVVETIWDKYQDSTGIELSEITHQKGSAWYKAFQEDCPFLRDEDIKEDCVG